jgi:hypothetical protein
MNPTALPIVTCDPNATFAVNEAASSFGIIRVTDS